MRLHALIRHCRDFGTDRIVTETGNLSPASPGVPAAPDHSAEAWAELRLIVTEALRVAADGPATSRPIHLVGVEQIIDLYPTVTDALRGR